MAFCFILKLKITLFYLLSFVFICCTTPCHSLSLIVICYHSLSFVVTRCLSLSFVVTQFITRCHSLYHSLSFVVTRCTTRLSFYKRSIWSKIKTWSFLELFSSTKRAKCSTENVFLQLIIISK